MSAPAFRSRWAEWNPPFPGRLSETEPAKPAKPSFEGFEGANPESEPGNRPPSGSLEGEGCTLCGSPLSTPGDVLCGGCYASRRGPGRVLAFDPGRRLRTIARLSGRPCGDCGSIDWYVSPRGDSACKPCARARGAATTEPGTNGVLGEGAA